jgi:hypothetical protein
MLAEILNVDLLSLTRVKHIFRMEVRREFGECTLRGNFCSLSKKEPPQMRLYVEAGEVLL